MGDMGDVFREMTKDRKARAKARAEANLKILDERGIAYQTLGPDGPHLRIGDFDFWPSTGKWINRKAPKRIRGWGINGLLKRL